MAHGAVVNHSLRRWRPGDSRKVLWIELFFDLIFVATIIQLGNLLAHDVSWRGMALYALVFVPVWWSWSGMAFFFNRFIADDATQRLLVLAQMFAIAILATQVAGAFGAQSMGFAAAYAAVRALLLLAYLRAWRSDVESRPLTRGYLLGFGMALVLWLASLLVPEPLRFAVWGLAMLVELLTPLHPAMRRMQHRWPVDLHHLQERFALFTLIVLGESFIKVLAGLVGHPLSVDAFSLSLAGFVVVGALWWWYFDRLHPSLQGGWPVARYVWIYSHLPLTVAVVAVGVGLKKLVLLELDALMPAELAWLFVVGSLLGVAVFTVLQWFAWVAGQQRPAKILMRFGVVAAALLALGTTGSSLSSGIFATLWCLTVLYFVRAPD